MAALADSPLHSVEGETAMFARLERSWNLVKASADVLQQDKELLIFPLISTISLIVVMACFALPVFGLASMDMLPRRADGHASPVMYVIAFLFYFTQYFVIFFFNTALVGAAMMRLDGKDPTVQDGIRIATSKIVVIMGYAFIAATVGMILRVIQERVGFIGKIIVAIIGAGWSLATYMVVPVLADRDVGPVEAIRESAALLRETWGENLIGQAGLGLAFGFIMFVVIVFGAFIVSVAFLSHKFWLLVLALVVAALAVAVTALVQAALSGIYAAALYRYATKSEGSQGFSKEAMELAFAPKR
jgi:hypothetical protein